MGNESLPEFVFAAGRVCLELTTTGGDGELARFERLHRPRELAEWLSEAVTSGTSVRADSEDLVAAKQLREAIRRAVYRTIDGQPLPRRETNVLNQFAEAPTPVPRIVGDAKRWASPVAASAALAVIARDAIDLFTGPQAQRVRECANPNCRLVFVDTSRPGQRRWCSMERCGNRAKAAGFRQRHLGAGGSRH